MRKNRSFIQSSAATLEYARTSPPAPSLIPHRLKSGQKFKDSFFEELLIENGDYACFNRGLLALEKSMKSEKMLVSYLKEKK